MTALLASLQHGVEWHTDHFALMPFDALDGIHEAIRAGLVERTMLGNGWRRFGLTSKGRKALEEGGAT